MNWPEDTLIRVLDFDRSQLAASTEPAFDLADAVFLGWARFPPWEGIICISTADISWELWDESNIHKITETIKLDFIFDGYKAEVTFLGPRNGICTEVGEFHCSVSAA